MQTGNKTHITFVRIYINYSFVENFHNFLQYTQYLYHYHVKSHTKQASLYHLIYDRLDYETQFHFCYLNDTNNNREIQNSLL